MGRRWLSAQTPTWTQQATTVSERSQLGDTVLILANPHAGSGRRHRLVQHLIDALDARGVRSVRVGTVAELAERGAELMAAGQLRCLVAAGGDGTVQAVLNHGPRSVPLVPLALGTENLLARYLKCGFQIGPLAEAIDACQSRRVDVGEVIDQTGKRRRFLLMFSCGFDAAVIAELDRGREGPIQHASYLRPIVRSLRD